MEVFVSSSVYGGFGCPPKKNFCPEFGGKTQEGQNGDKNTTEKSRIWWHREEKEEWAESSLSSVRTRVAVEVPNFWRNKRITSLAIRVTVIQYRGTDTGADEAGTRRAREGILYSSCCGGGRRRQYKRATRESLITTF